MHDYDSRVLLHVSKALNAAVYPVCSFADACWFAGKEEGGSQVIADGGVNGGHVASRTERSL